MRIAIIHDWLESYAGAERVLEQMLEMYPRADLFSLVDFVEGDRGWLKGRVPKTTFLQKIPGARKHFRKMLPLFPLAARSHDLRGYDLILSSSHCVAKNVKVRKGQVHVCYCHSPVRYAWDMQEEYLKQVGLDGGLKAKLIGLVMAYIRREDVKGSLGVSHFIANSRFIGARIRRCYGRDSVVINPPVNTEDFRFTPKKDDFYVTMSRMVPYKRIDLIAAAFRRMPEKKLVIIGSGPEFGRVREAAGGAGNVQLMGYQPFPVVVDHLQRAKAFVFAAREDFGIAPVEAMACGTPVIAFGEGGVLDSVEGLDAKAPSGVFFKEQTVDGICGAVQEFEAHSGRISAKACRARAEHFSNAAFRQRLGDFVNACLKARKA